MSGDYYYKPGWYVAICAGDVTLKSQPITVPFEFPEDVANGTTDAAWYFLNRVSPMGFLEMILPLSSFKGLFEKFPSPNFNDAMKAGRLNR